jgi:hypothetical protein
MSDAPDQRQVIADAIKALAHEAGSRRCTYESGGDTVQTANAYGWIERELRAALAASNAGTDPADGQTVAVGLSETESRSLDVALYTYEDSTVEQRDAVHAAVEAILAARRGQDTERGEA